MRTLEQELAAFLEFITCRENSHYIFGSKRHEVIRKWLTVRGDEKLAPEWLTESVSKKARAAWDAHEPGDRMRVEAMRVIQRAAEAAGKTIGVREATDLLIATLGQK